VWEKPDWPTPAEYRAGATFNPQDFHDDLITDRLSSTGIMNFYSDSGPGVTITDWNVLNEPLHVTHYSDTFETAGIYTSNIEAWADYFIRARAIRPDARLLINDYNILNSASDAATIEYRDLINSLRAAGAPIDRIGLQAHIALDTITKADIVRRLDILAETGLTIEITEFDSRDDDNQLDSAQQEQIFQDMLEAAFEHESVDGFIMWGFWDTGHWRGNAPLFDADWNTKTEAAPWFDLVHGDWKPNLVGQPVDAAGEWIAPEGLFDGSYDITARLNGQSTTLADVAVNGSGVQIVTIEIMVLDTIADDSGAILAKDSADNLYVNTQPVLYQGQPVPQAFFGHTVVGVDTSNSANALLLQSLVADGNQPTHRLLTDETWRINSIFNSLQNESSPSLDISGREITSIVNVAAVFGAYEINGAKNPILFVRRSQTYTFNLNTPSHPFYLQTTGNGHQSADIYSRGFSGNGQTSGEYQWVVPQDAPDELFYQCKFHSVMFGKIIVMD
jgi:hypothetical protein